MRDINDYTRTPKQVLRDHMSLLRYYEGELNRGTRQHIEARNDSPIYSLEALRRFGSITTFSR